MYTILTNRHKLVDHDGISIKPYLSRKEQMIESILLRQRRILIDSGTDRSRIRIRGTSIYVNKQKYGYANESEFTHIALPIMHGQTPNDRSDSVINVETSELQQRQHEQPVDITVIDSHNPPLNPNQSIHVNDNKSNPQQ